MNRYCISRAGSNVIYVFNSQKEADEQVHRLDAAVVLRSVHTEDPQPLTLNDHRLLQFQKLSSGVTDARAMRN